MEIEFKYLIPDESIVEKFWQEAVFKKYGDVDSRQSVQMRAAYYDTPDGILSSVDAAFRIRHEGPHVVATIKWGGRQKEGLHEREELNIQLADSFDDSMASLDVFAESEKGRELIELIGDRPLQKKLETDFLRRIRRIDTGTAICEAALDIGKIVTAAGELIIRELELELYSGEILSLKAMGEDLAARFGLVPGVKSKYGRGMELLRGSSFSR
ncbi:MAG: CYTH domain-containing protein [Anaerovoracaceae bacterium]